MYMVSFTVCVGTTPKRKEYAYPRVLVSLRSRTELEEEFRTQQEQLMSTFGQYEVLTEGEEEEKPVDQVHPSHHRCTHDTSF